MSAGHLSREFKKAFGESPYSYLMTRRIERAMTLLRRGDLSVTEVCLAVGGTSLGSFSRRFTELVGEPVMRYLTDWRLHVAQDLLATTDLSVAAVARRVGYDAEEAFSRAFKRSYGAPPGTWRAVHRPRRYEPGAGGQPRTTRATGSISRTAGTMSRPRSSR